MKIQHDTLMSERTLEGVHMSEMVLPSLLFRRTDDRIDVLIDPERNTTMISCKEYVLFVDMESDEFPALVGFGITNGGQFCRRHHLSAYTMTGAEFLDALSVDQRYAELIQTLNNLDYLRKQLRDRMILM